jgi:hypothetical protein
VLSKNRSKINLGRGRFGEAPPALEFTLRAAGVGGVAGRLVLAKWQPLFSTSVGVRV